ncbi:splicing factor 3B subunit 10, putative [Entamoeba histolytica HM-1:IMSS-B]|uniref:Splicing factor subunit n=7 Tax=Entamoeba TaxID=5758 RepID=C4M9T8_ENTH1|nr:splicing factor 3B subunit 10, putative [Entamoeba nuttalli P19]XP_651445.1 splicing factor 3B subunit 10, putative [Entamoeba histolytica HM-1:IMSS]EMD47529.1 splicing factor 3B subunit 10, putative [Entamoeba histolytica KU27]EMH73885.1 splicing factor 3B subunit 10, putative [Entamoeba histolytica HM-1:IMSS-B]ENY60946.1 splicing factor 3B subunit 10, putative [Entamoeba histolytica HM-1:IMSS-A]GAT98486.1 splicing factor 3b subunit 10 putative [Entamoeba histolytica]EAL46064.1 splicing f|eukprot:XP_008857240.1 splicing factor 3B subunit 10, putative [Entamoeba nuttalli P19]
MASVNKETLQTQLEHMQLKYVGTGHPDISKYEWICNQQRDSYASYIGHHSLMAYIAVAENQSIGRTRYQFLERMCDPCGKPPPEKNGIVITEEDMKPLCN